MLAMRLRESRTKRKSPSFKKRGQIRQRLFQQKKQTVCAIDRNGSRKAADIYPHTMEKNNEACFLTFADFSLTFELLTMLTDVVAEIYKFSSDSTAGQALTCLKRTLQAARNKLSEALVKLESCPSS